MQPAVGGASDHLMQINVLGERGQFFNPQSATCRAVLPRRSPAELGARQRRVPNPQSAIRNPQWAETRVHFHIPLHTPPAEGFDTTSGHLLGALDALQANPNLCSHLEMETYTWDVLPPEFKSRSVVDQLAAEYEWCLRELRQRRLA